MVKISVVVPTYNSARYLSSAIDSILSQAFQDFEIIVVDDGSTDGTSALMKFYIENNTRKIIYCSQSNRGPGSARNKGMEMAKGDYIAFLDADDIWLPHKLEKQIKLLEDKSEIGFVYCDNYFVNENGDDIPNYIRKIKLVQGNIALDLFLDHFIMAQAVVFRKNCLSVIGNFNEHLRVGEDYDFFLRLANKYNAAVIKEKLWKRVVRRSSISRENYILDAQNDLKTLKNFLILNPMFSKKYQKEISARLGSYHFSFGYHLLENDKNWAAFYNFAQSINYKFSRKTIKNIFLCLLPKRLRNILKGETNGSS